MQQMGMPLGSCSRTLVKHLWRNVLRRGPGADFPSVRLFPHTEIKAGYGDVLNLFPALPDQWAARRPIKLLAQVEEDVVMFRSCVGTAYKLAVLQVCLAATLVLPADAGSAVSLQASVQAAAGSAGPRLDVQSTAGRYDRIAATSLNLALRLTAEPASEAGGAKIITSELFLKQAGSGKDAVAVAAMEGQGPQRVIRLEQTFAFAIDALGPIAQNAISACNALTTSSQTHNESRETTMMVPVLWRVVTGRFNYKWVTYDQVAPANEASQNPDFYGDRETQEIETPVRVIVSCPVLSAAVAAKAAEKPAVKPEPVAKIAPEATPVAKRATAPVVTKTAEAAPVTASAKPVCHGGFIRQMQSGDVPYLCLCPGNTQRLESGTNAFSCERRSSRRS